LEKCNVSSVLNERVVLSQLSHPFIVNMHSAFHDEANLFLTMDYLRGADLRYHICYKEHFSEK
jgi:serum/glucocorticoid-regulated kinase 2